jgi:hypothetical protein
VLVPVAARNVPARLDRLSGIEPGALVLAYQTVMRDYLEPGERAEYEDGMEEWLQTHPSGHTLWVELEAGPEGRDAELPAELRAHVRAPDGAVQMLVLARAGLHPRRLAADAGAVETLRGLLVPRVAPVQHV